MNEFSLN